MKATLHALGLSLLIVTGISAYANNRQAAKLEPEPKEFACKGDASHGKALFTQNACMTCHGSKGNGKGIASTGLTPPPADFTDPVEMKKRSDWRFFNVIKNGGDKVGLSGQMASYSSLSDQDIKDLVVYIRTFSSK